MQWITRESMAVSRRRSNQKLPPVLSKMTHRDFMIALPTYHASLGYHAVKEMK